MSEKLGSVLGALRRHSGALALSGASQVVSSLTNFAIVMYLVRVLERAEFGLYSLGFAAYLVIFALIAFVVAVQYVVNNPDRAEHEQRSYAMHHVAAVVVIGAVIVMFASMLKATLTVDTGLIHRVMGLAFPVALAAAGFAIRDMAVRVAYVERREWLVLGSAMSVAVISAIAFLTASAMSIDPSAPMALGIVALTQLVGAAFTLLMLRLPWRQLTMTGLRQAFVDSWRGGRWHAITSIVYSVRANAHNFIILPILGLGALAEVNAARILVMPAVMAIPPLYQVVMPRLAEKRIRDFGRIQRNIWIAVGGLAGFALTYSLALLLALNLVLPMALGPSYANLEPIVMAWCAFTVALAARNGLAMGLELRKGFGALLAVNTIAAVVAVILAAVLSMLWGSLGAVWAMALAELVLCLLLYHVLILPRPKEVPTSAGNAGAHGMVLSLGRPPPRAGSRPTRLSHDRK